MLLHDLDWYDIDEELKRLLVMIPINILVKLSRLCGVATRRPPRPAAALTEEIAVRTRNKLVTRLMAAYEDTQGALQVFTKLCKARHDTGQG